MSGEKPQTIYRADYREPDYWIDSVDLDFDLGDDVTAVRAKLGVRRNPMLRGDPPPTVLAGEALSLKGLFRRTALIGGTPTRLHSPGARV